MSLLSRLSKANPKRSDFAIPERRAYPIPDEQTARASLARAMKFGTEEEQRRVKAAVGRKFPRVVE